MKVVIHRRKQYMDGIFAKFKTVISYEKNCHCDFCGKVTRVYKLYHPSTELDRWGNPVVSYTETWMCPECKEKLTQSLFCATMEKTVGEDDE